MRRTLALVTALLALIAAGFFWTRDRPVATAAQVALPEASRDDDDDEGPLVAPASPVTEADREARRFGRYDKDRDAAIARGEYLASRQKAFAKLDIDRDGRLGFEEFAAASAKKFNKADRDADGRLSANEFATTAAKRRAASACKCDA